jgi:hypothetical protein
MNLIGWIDDIFAACPIPILLKLLEILEAANAAGEFFGKQRLSNLLTATAGLSTEEAADRILPSARS